MLAAAIGIYDPNDGIQDLKDMSQEQAAVNLEKIKKVVDKKLRSVMLHNLSWTGSQKDVSFSENDDKHVTFRLSVDVCEFDPKDKSLVIEEVTEDLKTKSGEFLE